VNARLLDSCVGCSTDQWDLGSDAMYALVGGITNAERLGVVQVKVSAGGESRDAQESVREATNEREANDVDETTVGPSDERDVSTVHMSRKRGKGDWLYSRRGRRGVKAGI
jgi:hypothetical protein